MTPKQALEQINKSETDLWVCAQLAAMGVKVTQPTINKIRRGDIRRTSYQTGEAILKLWKRVERRKR